MMSDICHIKRIPLTLLKRFMAASLVFMTGISVSIAGPKIWNTTTGDWLEDAKWTPSGAPGVSDDVVITNVGANVLLTNSASIQSLTLSRTLVFSNWDTTLTVASNVIVQSGGTITLPAAFTNAATSNRVSFSSSNVIIETGGVIDANAKGYAGGTGGGAVGDRIGNGPGKGEYNAGAGYGGKGGNASYGVGVGGNPYGSSNAPADPGSGGGGGNTGVGGNGGGAVWIQATGGVTLNGSIRANGGAGTGTYAGGGSGGGIYISCNTFAGTNGVIQANGGSGGSGGGAGGSGGGGRIAVVINDMTTQTNTVPAPLVTFSTSRGSVPWNGDIGGVGTIWLSDSRALQEVFTNADAQLFGCAAWSPNNLTLSNSWISLPAGFTLSVATNLNMVGSLARLDITNSSMICGGDLRLTNSAAIYVYSGVTNGSSTNYGALVSITNDVEIGTNCWIYPYSDSTNGGSPLFQMRNLTILTNAGFNADAKGFAGGTGGGAVSNRIGYGTGKGEYNAGAGYGGKGGNASYGVGIGGNPYGSSNAPADPGSGGGGGNTGVGGNGGGLVWIQATGGVTLNGSIRANGGAGTGTYAGGGSGGGIYISCNTFAGTNGVIQANGGSGGSGGGAGGSGGGGRIAVVINDMTTQTNTVPAPLVTFSTSRGSVPWNGDIGGVGTIWLSDSRALQEVFTNADAQLFGCAAWSPNNLTLSNSWISLPDGFTLSVATNFNMVGSLARLDITNSSMSCGGNMGLTNAAKLYIYNSSVNCGGNLSLTNNGAAIYVYSGATNGSSTNYGALVSVTNDVVISDTCWIYPYSHSTNGGSPLFQMRNLKILTTNAGFNADAKGFAGGTGGGAVSNRIGYGSGKGQYRAGGGYGGKGGDVSPYLGGDTYGSSNAPADPGSGGGGGGSGFGGNGGGLVRILASGTITMNGMITAKGASGATDYAGGGSGGGIYITCKMFAGTNGVLLANGGTGGSAGQSAAGGGGGRIAVWRNYDMYGGSITTNVQGGTGLGGQPAGSNGTVVYVWAPRLIGTLMQIF